MPHIEVNPAAVEEETAVPGRLFVIAIMEVDRAGPHPPEKLILHPDRPGVAVRVRGVAAHQAAVFGLDACDPIHPRRSSDTRAPWTRDKAGRNFVP